MGDNLHAHDVIVNDPWRSPYGSEARKIKTTEEVKTTEEGPS
jgi:hypothetical protein